MFCRYACLPQLLPPYVPCTGAHARDRTSSVMGDIQIRPKGWRQHPQETVAGQGSISALGLGLKVRNRSYSSTVVGKYLLSRNGNAPYVFGGSASEKQPRTARKNGWYLCEWASQT